ncbi:hypothetical protein RRF57_009590 [Xylaria bambusicola]|uniref:Uncharacterized protein n=1 Tax=Xylaria bambusicola TaxID=326684 RepID=A0AAN7ZC19_9PEZI
MAITGIPQHLLDNTAGRDDVLDYDQSINRQHPIEIFQEPPPCYSERYDGCLVDYGGLPDIDSTALDIGLPSVPVLAQQLRYKDDRDYFDRYWSQTQTPSTSAGVASIASPKDVEEDRVKNTADNTTQTPTQCSYSLDKVNSGHRGSTGYTTLLYGWQEAPLYEDQLTFGVQNTTKAMDELKEMERNFQTDTKQRISQIKSDSLGLERPYKRKRRPMKA